MWALVMFDLPVTTAAARKEYVKFRHFLLDNGFSMSQYSVYFRMLSSKDKVFKLERRIAERVPPNGHVQLIAITDKQYEQIRIFHGNIESRHKIEGQLLLF